MKLEEYFKIYGTYRIKNGLYNVTGDIELIKKVQKLHVKFGIVTSNFYCDDNDLISLEGAPKYIGGDFLCYSNNLTSLEGCPIKIGGVFFCYNNKLTSLEGCPKSIGGEFVCDNYLHNNLEYKQHLILKKLKK